jgi:hypothetical protein
MTAEEKENCKCFTNKKKVSQYIDEGQVTCYLKCEKWKEWTKANNWGSIPPVCK